jgi:hypothetical protein
MNKRTPMIILGAIIAIVVIGVSVKPLLVRYQLHRYSRAHAMRGVFDSTATFDPDKFRADLDKQIECLMALERLGHLASFNLPVRSPGADSEAAMGLISSFCATHNYPVLASLDSSSTNIVLNIIDKPDTRPFWEMFVRMYIEAKE